MVVKIRFDKIPKKYIGNRQPGTIKVLSAYIPFERFIDIKDAIVYNKKDTINYVANLFRELNWCKRKREIPTAARFTEIQWRRI